MKVCFRTTCSNAIGYGHLRRCLTLADALKETGVASLFALAGEVRGLDVVSDAGYLAESSPPFHGCQVVPLIAKLCRGASVLVLDDYAIGDARGAEIAAAVAPTRVLVIDDLAERALAFAHAILNPTAGLPVDVYAHARRANARLALGPRFALLRNEFRHQEPRLVRDQVERVLVTMGGADPDGLSAGVVRDLVGVVPRARIDVVCGPLFAASTVHALAEVARGHPQVQVHAAGAQVCDLMRAADLGVAAGGQTVFELAATGLPTVAVRVADNQHRNLAEMQRAQTLVHSSREALGGTVLALANDAALRAHMAQAGQALVDGCGGKRAAELVHELGAA